MAEKEEKTAAKHGEPLRGSRSGADSPQSAKSPEGVTSPEGAAENPDLPSELDKTRMDIDARGGLGREPTKTEIRVKTEAESDNKEVPSSFFGRAFNRVKRVGRLNRLSRLSRYSGIWTPDPDAKGLSRILFLFSRLLIAAAGGWLHYLLFRSFFKAYEGAGTDPAVGAVLGVAGGALVLALLSVVFRRHPAWFAGFPLLGILGLLGFHVFFHPTTDPSFFTLIGRAPAFVFNHVWIGILGLELVLILFVYPRSRILKGIFFVLAAYGLSGFAVNRLEGIALEAAWLGTGIFKSLPVVFIQPVFVAQAVFIPLFFLFSLGAFFLPVNFKKGRSPARAASRAGAGAAPWRGAVSWIGLNLLILLFSAAMGWIVMQKNGVPTLLSFFLEERRGVGLVQTPVSPEQGRGVDGRLLEVKTADFDLFREKDTVARYRMELKEKVSKPSETSKYYLSVHNLDGFPVFFLTQSDFEVSTAKHSEAVPEGGSPEGMEEKKLSQWALEPVTVSEEERDKIGMRRPPLYLLSVVVPKMPPVKKGEETAVSKKTVSPDPGSLWNLAGKEGSPTEAPSLPRLDFVRPTLGEYVSIETKIEVSGSFGTGPAGETVTLFLDNEKIHEWPGAAQGGAVPQEYTWLWNTADLSLGSYVLKVEGKIGGKIVSSDQTPVFMGESRLKVMPPEGSVTQSGPSEPAQPVEPVQPAAKGKGGALNYQDVVFILDFSISQWDGWMGKSKWEWQKKLFDSASVIQKLSGSNVGVVVFGNQKSYHEQDCSDASWLVKPGPFSARKIVDLLGKEKPKGVSALFEALKMALEKKPGSPTPQKIVIIADGADSCRSIIGSLIDKTAGTVIDVLTPGGVSEKDAQILKQLAETSGGNFFSAKNRREFEEKTGEMLTRYFHLLLGDKTVLSAPVDGKPNSLRPGEYQLRLLMNPPFADRPILLKNGLTTEIRLKVKLDKTGAEETSYPF